MKYRHKECSPVPLAGAFPGSGRCGYIPRLAARDPHQSYHPQPPQVQLSRTISCLDRSPNICPRMGFGKEGGQSKRTYVRPMSTQRRNRLLALGRALGRAPRGACPSKQLSHVPAPKRRSNGPPSYIPRLVRSAPSDNATPQPPLGMWPSTARSVSFKTALPHPRT